MIFFSDDMTRYGNENVLCIELFPRCNYLPDKQYHDLVPKYWFWMNYDWGDKRDDGEYIRLYVSEVLYKLDFDKTVKELDNKILIARRPETKVFHLEIVEKYFKSKGIETNWLS